MPFTNPTRRRARALVTVALTFVLAACGGGDAPGTQVTDPPDPPGPDVFGTHTVGTIVVASGTNQVVSAGQSVPQAPLVRVTSERGRPLKGATLALTAEGGKGVLDASTVVTNDAGEATFPRWVAPLTAGEFAVTIAGTAQGGATVTARVTASVSPDELTIATQSIGPSGGTVSVTSTTSALNGMSIIVKPGALTTATTFTVTSAPPPPMPDDLTIASPVVGIDGPTFKMDSVLTIRLPATPGIGVARAYLVADDNSLVPIPTHTSDATSVTVLMRHLATPVSVTAGGAGLRAQGAQGATTKRGLIRVHTARWRPPASGVFNATFTIRVNNIGAANWGSHWTPGGFCVGATILNGDWWRQRGLAARLQFPELLTRAETNNWSSIDQLNPVIRLATSLQEGYQADVWTIGWLAVWFGQANASVWDNVVQTIVRYSRPVYVGIRSSAGGHAILATGVDLTLERIYVADPNFPEELGRYIQYRSNTRTFDNYSSAANLGSGGVQYTQFADATWLFQEEVSSIATKISQYLADGLRTKYPPVNGTIKLARSVVTAMQDVTNVAVESRDRDLRFVVNGLGSGGLAWVKVAAGSPAQNGSFNFFTNADTLRIPLATGLNKIGLVIGKNDAGGNPYWYDAKVLQITREKPVIKFMTQPVTANINKSLGSVRIGLVDEDDVLVPEQRSITLTLSGGASGAVLSGASNITTGADGSVTVTGLSVDKVGTGYTLNAASTGLASVASSSFNVNDGGAFTGRVFDAVTTNGLDGVAISVRASDGTVTSTGTTAGGGNFAVSGVPAGTYLISASKTGYVTTSLASQVMTLPSTIVEPIPLVPNNTPGGVSGNIRNASTNALITVPVTVELRAGLNVLTGGTAASVTTSSGTYTFANVPAGAYTIVAHATGFTDGSRTGIVVGAGSTVGQQDVLMSASSGAARVVLTWGASPSDLDSHLTGPTTGVNRFWVYYAGRGNCGASPFTCLDIDKTSGFGPETITLEVLSSGVYRYYVYDYSNRTNGASTALGASGAKVQFFVGNALKQTFFVPAGAGNAWAVFSWDGTTVTTLNNLYVISGVPQPALTEGPRKPLTAEEELRDLLSRLPVKPLR